MNEVHLIGRVTDDIELRQTQSGKSVVSFTLAVPKFKKDDGADFPNCVAWNATADLMSRFVRKGHRIAVSGRLSTRSYDDKNGRKIFVTEVVADNVEFLESKKTTNEAVFEETFSDNTLSDIDENDLPF